MEHEANDANLTVRSNWSLSDALFYHLIDAMFRLENTGYQAALPAATPYSRLTDLLQGAVIYLRLHCRLH